MNSGTSNDLQLAPSDFTNAANANTWRAIQHLRDRGEPVNAVTVFDLVHSQVFADRPVLSDRQLIKMALPPDTNADQVARSIRVVASAALGRGTGTAADALAAVAANRAIPAQGVLDQAARQVEDVLARARTAAARHAATGAHTSHRRSI
jgi:replicative DNA helicase